MVQDFSTQFYSFYLSTGDCTVILGHPVYKFQLYLLNTIECVSAKSKEDMQLYIVLIDVGNSFKYIIVIQIYMLFYSVIISLF